MKSKNTTLELILSVGALRSSIVVSNPTFPTGAKFAFFGFEQTTSRNARKFGQVATFAQWPLGRDAPIGPITMRRRDRAVCQTRMRLQVGEGFCPLVVLRFSPLAPLQ